MNSIDQRKGDKVMIQTVLLCVFFLDKVKSPCQRYLHNFEPSATPIEIYVRTVQALRL